MPYFSIVIPAYNAEDTLAETLDCVAAQEFSDWECIIVDDGSADGTAALANTYAENDARFRVISQPNKGTGGAYNTGVRAATGEWVSICSADDLLLPQHLSVMARAIADSPGHDIYSSNGYYQNPDGSRELVYSGPDSERMRSWSLAETFSACFYSVGACYRRGMFDEVGGYLEESYGEDYDFWLRAMAAGSTQLYTPEALSVHRRSPTQKSAALDRAYQSDIRSISSVLESGKLSAADAAAAKAAISHRKRMLFELGSLGGAIIGSLRKMRNLARGAGR